MKSVGNLTDFVREQMLGQTDIQSKIDELVSRYGDLTEAPKPSGVPEQSELLKPLVEEGKPTGRRPPEIGNLEAVLEEIPRYFARHRVRALQQQLLQLYSAWRQNEEEQTALSTLQKQQRQGPRSPGNDARALAAERQPTPGEHPYGAGTATVRKNNGSNKLNATEKAVDSC